MNGTEHIATVGPSKAASTVLDKEELVAHFNQLSEEAKAQFYKDCEASISAEQSWQNTLNFVQQLRKK